MDEEVELLKVDIENLRKELNDFKEEVKRHYKRKDVCLGNNIGGELGNAGW